MLSVNCEQCGGKKPTTTAAVCRACYVLNRKNTALDSKTPNKKCLWCSDDFYNKYSHVKYCSKKCSGVSKRRNPNSLVKEERKKEAAQRRKDKKNKVYLCSICKETEVKRCTKFCKPCRSVRNKVISSCLLCGSTFYHLNTIERKYCSPDCYRQCLKGKGNPNYIDGRTPENKRVRNSQEYKAWRTNVFERDNYTCVWCGQVGGELNADHIKPFATHRELRLDINNGRTLCFECHKKTPSYLKYNGKNKG